MHITNPEYTTPYTTSDTLSEHISKRGVDTIRIDGRTPLVTRHALVKKFQTVPSCRVALLSIATAGRNIHLSIAVIHVYTYIYIYIRIYISAYMHSLFPIHPWLSTFVLKRYRIDINRRIDGFLC